MQKFEAVKSEDGRSGHKGTGDLRIKGGLLAPFPTDVVGCGSE